MNDKFSFNDTFLKLKDINIHAVYAGENNEKLMIFLHGFPECWYSWRHQIKYFSKNYFTIAPDLRGYNLSSKPKEKDKYSIKYLVEDVRDIITFYEREDAIIIGHDWGGVIAWWTAMKYPKLTRKLVILNAPHPGIWFNKVKFLPRQLRKSWYIFFFQVERTPEEYFSYNNFMNLRLTLENSTYRKNVFSKEDIEKYVECWRNSESLEYMINYYRVNLDPRTFMSFRSGFKYPKIKSPTLVIWGEHDFALEKDLTIGTEEYVDAFYKIKYIEAGHWVQQEAYEEVNSMIEEFIKD